MQTNNHFYMPAFPRIVSLPCVYVSECVCVVGVVVAYVYGYIYNINDKMIKKTKAYYCMK